MRHFFLVSYDVSDEKRLRRMFKLLRGYGDHVQYSVFLCQLSEKDYVILEDKIKCVLNHKEDQAILIKLGPVKGKTDTMPKYWTTIGTPFEASNNAIMIY
ncbi:CRISPR-associated endonuclease Cas2 [Desulfovibrio inopinatus]|uniref:CRISPR-associated endonuclease Cas2 n=1 Tax=Desulfovibrio inopinatus TaxID=102109 RepID=UPI0004259AD1|nr:CRISPR-associated endonuclease Cas2 [Desulfovibrio inopinatus]